MWRFGHLVGIHPDTQLLQWALFAVAGISLKGELLFAFPMLEAFNPENVKMKCLAFASVTQPNSRWLSGSHAMPKIFAAAQISLSYRGVIAGLKNAECLLNNYTGRTASSELPPFVS